MRLKYTNKEYIKKCNVIHKFEYKYNKCLYKGARSKVTITCSKHGDFNQRAYNHLNGVGCPDCYGTTKYTRSEYINLANIKHDNFYDYSKLIYINGKSNVDIICPLHGKFTQIAQKHLNGDGCVKCGYKKTGYSKYRLDSIEYISELEEKCHIIHNNSYEYDFSMYENCKSYIDINCKKHGKFKQNMNSHLHHEKGCPICSTSKGERRILTWLIVNNVFYKTQKKFEGCIFKYSLKFDFYLPNYNMCIEYDGVQHFRPVEFFGGYSEFKKRIIRDNIKNNYCKDNTIELVRISYLDFKNIEKILTDNVK